MDSHEMLPLVQSAPLSSKISLNNIDLKLKSKDTILGQPNYSFSRYIKPSWRCNSSQNQHGLISTSSYPQIRHPLWPRKAEKSFERSSITHRLCGHISLKYIMPSCVIKNNCAMTWSGKKYTSKRGQRGTPQLLTWTVLFITIGKWTMYTMAPLWNSPFTSIKRNYSKNLSRNIHQCFGNVSNARLKQMSRKGLMEVPQTISLTWNIPYLFFSYPEQLKLPEFQPLTSQIFPSGFMLQMDFPFFGVESIGGYTSTFLDICSATSYLFGFPSRIKRSPIDILKFLITAFRNQDKKVTFVQVDEDGAMSRSSEFMNTCHNINIIYQTMGGDSYSRHGTSKSLNNTISNITGALLLNSSHKKDIWCFAYHCAIWISHQNYIMLHGDVPYFIWHGSRT